jgi:tRNA A-37 threonylcarbamoyl transferase component Bud32
MAEFLMGETGELEPLNEGKREAPDKPPLEPGSTIRGMEVLEFLGQGGMGFVYKARQPSLDRVVALKILDPRLAASAEFTSRFNREAKALAALSHPNIVQVHDYGQEEEHYFLVMEFIDGASLRQVLTTQRMTPETALRYVPQICDALEYAHSEGVIHRDIKPENILIDKRGNLKIADFGLAKMAVPEGQARSQATASGRVMGTPHYMAPEQVNSMSNVDHRVDIYSLGVVFYEMLTGDLPLGRFSLPSERVKVDVRIDDVVLKALEQDPERRYQRASEVKTDLMTPKRAFRRIGERLSKGGERNKAMNRKWPIGVFVCTAVVFISAFMPWGSFTGNPGFNMEMEGPFRDLMGRGNPFGGMKMTFEVNGWNGTLTLLGIKMPNWMPFVVSLVIGLLALLRALESLSAPRAISFVLAGYGVLHAGMFIIIIGSEGNLGFGCFATLGAFVAIVVLLIREINAEKSSATAAKLAEIRSRSRKPVK